MKRFKKLIDENAVTPAGLNENLLANKGDMVEAARKGANYASDDEMRTSLYNADPYSMDNEVDGYWAHSDAVNLNPNSLVGSKIKFNPTHRDESEKLLEMIGKLEQLPSKDSAIAALNSPIGPSLVQGNLREDNRYYNKSEDIDLKNKLKEEALIKFIQSLTEFKK